MERVQQVETKVSNMETRLNAVENSLDSVENGDLVTFQKKILASLRTIRKAMNDEETTKKQFDQSNESLLEENIALKKQVSKLNYRIEHLLRHIPQQKQ